MMLDCDVVRDLLPLYADDACSEKSRALVKEHLLECAECRAMLIRLKNTEIEDGLKNEKGTVIQYGVKRFKRRSAAVGSVVSGLFMVPILICLIVNFVSGPSLDWFTVVLAALAVAASLTVVPLMVSEDKAFWTLCAFTASLMLLLGVTCLYSGGSWFFIASSACLFGLAVVFLPFAMKARPVKRLVGEGNRWLITIGLDAALFFNMMNMISAHGRLTLGTILFTIAVFAGVGLVVTEIMRKRGNKNE